MVIVGLAALGLSIPSLVGMTIPFVVVMKLVEDDFPRARDKAALALLALWAWAYLPIAHHYFWRRGGILTYGVVAHGVVAALLAFFTLLVCVKNERKPQPEPAARAVSLGEERHCYLHQDRESWIRCSRCERFVCVECMQTAVSGFECPDCSLAAGSHR
jgi:hypothetical protein